MKSNVFRLAAIEADRVKTGVEPRIGKKRPRAAKLHGFFLAVKHSDGFARILDQEQLCLND